MCRPCNAFFVDCLIGGFKMITKVIRYNNHVFTLDADIAAIFYKEPIAKIWHIERDWVFGNVIKFLEVKQVAHF